MLLFTHWTCVTKRFSFYQFVRVIQEHYGELYLAEANTLMRYYKNSVRGVAVMHFVISRHLLQLVNQTVQLYVLKLPFYTTPHCRKPLERRLRCCLVVQSGTSILH